MTEQMLERPQFSQLDHDLTQLTDEQRKESKQAMINELAGKLGEEGVPQAKRLTVASWQVAQSIKHGYVIPGWRLIDYIRASWEGYETDQLAPLCVCGEYVGQSEEAWAYHVAHPEKEGEHYRKPRKRLEIINVWGVQGATKSSYVAQLLGLGHGGYNPKLDDLEWRKVWDWCQKVTVTNRKDLEEVGKLLAKPGARLDMLYFDDLNSIISKQLAWEDRDLYRLTFKLLGMVRRQVGTIVTSEPNIEMVIGAFNRVMTMEVIVYPNSSYKVERMCHDIHPYFWATDKVTKIVVEESKFDPYDTPLYYWRPYEERTNSVGFGAFKEVTDRMAELESEGDGNGEARKLASKAFTISDVREAAAKVGIKASGEKLAELNRELKDRAANRLNVPTVETPENSSEN